MKKIILDTNWWISFIISKNTDGLPIFFFGNILFCFSAELAVEIRSVLQYAYAYYCIIYLKALRPRQFSQNSYQIIKTHCLKPDE